MNSPLTIIRKTQNVVFYAIPEFSLVTNDFLNELEWPADIKTLGFIATGESGMVMFGDELSDKYSPRWTYSACLPKTAVGAAGAAPVAALTPGRIKDFEQLKKIYIDTHLDFYRAWSAKLGPGYMKGIDGIIARFLPSARTLLLEKNGEAAGLLTLIKWEDSDGAPVDWITWVWLREDLLPEERVLARGYVLDWLAANAGDRVQCGIDAFNLRSQKFFLKLGFSRQCLYVAKPQ